MNISKVHQTAEQVSNLMKILSCKSRFMILCAVADGEKSVGEISALIGKREAATSQQLALLRKDGIVQTRREGQTIYYSIARPDVRKLMDFIYENYCKQNRALEGKDHGGEDDTGN